MGFWAGLLRSSWERGAWFELPAQGNLLETRKTCSSGRAQMCVCVLDTTKR